LAFFVAPVRRSRKDHHARFSAFRAERVADFARFLERSNSETVEIPRLRERARSVGGAVSVGIRLNYGQDRLVADLVLDRFEILTQGFSGDDGSDAIEARRQGRVRIL